MRKITFGKIQLNVNKDEKKTISADEDNLTTASTSGKLNFCDLRILLLIYVLIYMVSRRLGFGTFGRNESAKANDKLNYEIEEIAEDLESQHVKEIMGISEFGRKAQSFDIIVS